MDYKYVTPEQMRDIDQTAQEKFGIPAIVLMENAGRSVYQAAIDMLKDKDGGVVCICGKGNNGGDGLVCARHLINNNIDVDIFLVGNPESLKGEASINYNILKNMNETVRSLNNKNLNSFKSRLEKTDLIIDALFGTGLTGKIKQPYKKIIELINESEKPVLSVDIPSGLDGTEGRPLPIAVKAAKTVTFAWPKTGLKKNQGSYYTGNLIVADISIPKIIL